MADRDGTYSIRYTTVSGDCGEFPETLGRLDSGAPVAPPCERTAPDDVSADECRLDRSIRCLQDGGETEVVGYTEDVSGDGSRLEGSMTFSITLADGQSCVGTYDVVAVRQ